MATTQTTRQPTLAHGAPVFLVDDVAAAAGYYENVLGFVKEWIFGEPPTYGQVSRGSVVINLAKSDQPGKLNSTRAVGTTTKADLNIEVAGNLAALHQELVGRGAQVDGPPTAQPYGMTSFNVLDPNGYCLCFGQVTVGYE